MSLIKNIHTFTEQPLVHVKKKHTLNPKHFGKVVVLYGGRSKEREISLESGQACLEALLRQGVNAHPLDPKDDLPIKLREGNYDRALIMLHGHEGEDGVVQSILQMMGIPYTGSGVCASALAMNKSRAKLIMHALGIPTPPFGIAHTTEQAKALVQELGLPVSVKPVNEGSSLGVACVEDLKQLDNAFKRAQVYGEVMVEKWITGADFFVSILGDQVLPPVQVKPADRFYDYHAKYKSNKTQYLCPSPISKEQDQALRNMAFQAFRALGCKDWGRVDLVQDQTGQFWVLEVNTIPGMTSHSLVPMSAKAQGITFDELVLSILAMTLSENQALVGNFNLVP